MQKHKTILSDAGYHNSEKSLYSVITATKKACRSTFQLSVNLCTPLYFVRLQRNTALLSYFIISLLHNYRLLGVCLQLNSYLILSFDILSVSYTHLIIQYCFVTRSIIKHVQKETNRQIPNG